MKKWFYSTCMMLLAVAACGCSSDKEYVEPQLDVTPHNISGEWQLESWQQGQQMAEGSYVYLSIERKDALFTIYQKIDSFRARKITGRYAIEIDPELGGVIRGMYDYDGGDWAHRYIITSLTADRMVWVAKDARTDVSVYVRADIPAEVVAEAE